MNRTDRMPTIGFSEEADYDGLFTMLTRADFLYDFVLMDGTVHTGRFHGNEGDTMLVAIHEDSEPTGAIASFPANDLAKVVYL